MIVITPQVHLQEWRRLPPQEWRRFWGRLSNWKHILKYSRAFFLFSHNKQIVHKIPLVTNLYIQLRDASYTYQVYKTVCRDNKVSTLNHHRWGNSGDKSIPFFRAQHWFEYLKKSNSRPPRCRCPCRPTRTIGRTGKTPTSLFSARPAWVTTPILGWPRRSMVSVWFLESFYKPNVFRKRMQDLHKALHHLQVVSGGEDEVQEDWGLPQNIISFEVYFCLFFTTLFPRCARPVQSWKTFARRACWTWSMVCPSR